MIPALVCVMNNLKLHRLDGMSMWAGYGIRRWGAVHWQALNYDLWSAGSMGCHCLYWHMFNKSSWRFLGGPIGARHLFISYISIRADRCGCVNGNPGRIEYAVPNILLFRRVFDPPDRYKNVLEVRLLFLRGLSLLYNVTQIPLDPLLQSHKSLVLKFATLKYAECTHNAPPLHPAHKSLIKWQSGESVCGSMVLKPTCSPTNTSLVCI